MPTAIEIDQAAIEAFCKKWKVTEFSLFGSVLREDFSADSDIDVLLDFDGPTGLSLFEWIEMKDELEALFGRPIDMLAKEGLRNPFRRESILNRREVMYAA